MDKIIKQVLSTYDRKVLHPEIGNGALKRRLIAGLENVLNNIQLPQNAAVADNSLSLDSPIDFNEIMKAAVRLGHSPGFGTRIYNALIRSASFKTYRDILNAYEERRKTLTEQHWYPPRDTFEFIRKYRNIGKKGAEVITEHLHSVSKEFN